MTELPIPPRVEREANPAIAELLKKMRVFLWDGSGEFGIHSGIVTICGCTTQFGDSDIAAELRAVIHHGIHPYGFYSDWASVQIGYDIIKCDEAILSIQAGRLRWINQLIEEFGGTP